jgi:hypothetical protein
MFILYRTFTPLWESLYVKSYTTKQHCSWNRLSGLLSLRTFYPGMIGYLKPIALIKKGQSYVIKCAHLLRMQCNPFTVV